MQQVSQHKHNNKIIKTTTIWLHGSYPMIIRYSQNQASQSSLTILQVNI